MKTQLRLSCLAILLAFNFVHSVTTLHAQGMSVGDTIAHIVKHNKKVAPRCEALYQLGTYYWNIGDTENAMQVMNLCKAEAEKHDYDRGSYDAYSIIGAIHLKQNEIEQVLSVANACFQLANKRKSAYGFNRASYLLMVMYHRMGQADSVVAIAQRALDADYTAYDSITLPKINALLANIFMDKGDLHSALTSTMN